MDTKNKAWSHIMNESDRTVTFLDLCGHEKYLKTTIFGMVGCLPDYALIVIGANMGVTRMTKEHLGIALALKIPVFIVLTKIDICPENIYKLTIETLTKILRSPAAGRMPVVVKQGDNIQEYVQLMETKLCPIFSISNVTGEGIPPLREFLSLLPSRADVSGLFKTASDPVEFLIDGIY